MTTPARVLAVDDTPTNLVLLRSVLEKAGFEVLTAADGFEAVEIAVRERPDLMLLDVMMPDRDGLETCSILKAQPDTASIPVIFVTSVAESNRILEAFSVGGCDYVTKPFKAQELLARVSVHIQLRRAEEELRLKNDRMEELATDLAETNARLVTLNRVDPLTQLLNRRTWEDAVVQEHQRCQRSGNAYGIVMIDVDAFKAFNDSLGHPAGDECLRRIGLAITSACRQVDTAGRYGGEEFVILVPDLQGEAAVKLAERIRKAVWDLGIAHPESATAGRVTVSLGVATSASGSLESVLTAADDAMYVAKKAGRNMVHSSHGAPATLWKGLTRSVGEEPDSECTLEQTTRVLVVDDEPTNRAVCCGCLARAGYLVSEAVDGSAALTFVEADPPDVIIMDVMMPKMDGLECTRQLKANPETRDIPVVIVSALTKSDDILAGLEAGADEYLTKPIRTSELVLRVRSMARQHRDRTDLLASHVARGEHVRALTALVEFCRAIAVSNDMDEVLDHTIKTVGDLARSSRVSIMMPDDHRLRLTIRKSSGLDEELAAAVVVPVGEPIAGKVFSSRRPTVINTDEEGRPEASTYDSHFFASVPLISAPLGVSDHVVGVLNVTERAGGRPFEPHELEYIELIGNVAASTIHNLSTREARDQASDSIMVALAKLAEHRDNDTGLHLDRVTRYCRILAEDIRDEPRFRGEINDAFLCNLVRAAPLHDIGKVAIPDHILLRPGKLSAEEMTVMRTHAEIGANTIRSLIERSPAVGFLEMAANIAHYHHEWYDGSGYPTGLREDAIPLSARISAIADVYDALTTKRVYKEAIPHDRAAAIVLEGSGTQFDPDIVEAFVRQERQFAELAESMADESAADTTARPAPRRTISTA